MEPEPNPFEGPTPGQQRITLLKQWAATAAGVVVALNVISGIRCDSFTGLLLASLILGLLNITFSGLKIFLGCLSLGLFAMIINAMLLKLVAWAVPAFHVDDFGSAFLGGIIISLVSVGVLVLTAPRTGKGRWGNAHFEINVQTGRPRNGERRREIDKDDDDKGSGPVIDV